jgi:hypothetical protein
MFGHREPAIAEERGGGYSSMIYPPLLALQRIFSRRVVSVEGLSHVARDSKKPGKEVLTTML